MSSVPVDFSSADWENPLQPGEHCVACHSKFIRISGHERPLSVFVLEVAHWRKQRKVCRRTPSATPAARRRRNLTGEFGLGAGQFSRPGGRSMSESRLIMNCFEN